DGRVLVAGGQGDRDHYSAELYSPPYLFKGARPTIANAPGVVGYGATFAVDTPDAAGVASVALVELGAVTHATDMDQRYVPLEFARGAGTLSVQGPPDANTAPPGYYMLFVVDGGGVPSVGRIVPVGGAGPAPTATASSTPSATRTPLPAGTATPTRTALPA